MAPSIHVYVIYIHDLMTIFVLAKKVYTLEDTEEDTQEDTCSLQ